MVRDYTVYWIHSPDHDSPYQDGYVGVTRREPYQRFKEHARFHLKEQISAGAKMTLLHTDLNIDDAMELEKQYRPVKDLAWNRMPGGYFNGFGYNFGKIFLHGDERSLAQKNAASKHSETMKSKTPWNKGKTGLQTMSPEHRAKISQANKKEKQIVSCTHCDKSGGKPVMERWHFENCKHKV